MAIPCWQAVVQLVGAIAEPDSNISVMMTCTMRSQSEARRVQSSCVFVGCRQGFRMHIRELR
jgi:hypothetical protein